MPLETYAERRLWRKRGADAVLRSTRDVTLWQAETAANRLGYRLAITPILDGEDPVISPLDATHYVSKLRLALRRLAPEQFMKNAVIEFGWAYEYHVHPLVKALAHVIANRRLTPADVAREGALKPANIQSWLKGDTHPSIENFEATLNAAGLGLRIVSLPDSDSVRYATMETPGADFTDQAPVAV